MIKGGKTLFYFSDFKRAVIWSKRQFFTNSSNGFTLIEILVVIALLAVLATAVVLVLNPAELLKEGRDSTRLSDLASLNTALALFQVDQYDQNMGTASTTYISIPDTSPTCSDLGLPALSIGWSYHCVPAASSSAVNGTGWVPVNFNLISSGAPLPRLPVDPINSTSTGEYYTYTPGGSFELTALMESTKYRSQVNANPSLLSYPNVVAIGSDLNLSPIYSDNPTTLPVAYWPLDEDTGRRQAILPATG
ncbi:type II secretion system GspH family protein [Patescibacteria group bacterium]|nr:type II secretion system GspH family protein [Patescibacteria group bacterium]